MDLDAQRSLSLRGARRSALHSKELEGNGSFSADRAPQELPRMVWRTCFARLILVSVVAWMLLILFALAFHVWSCRSSITFFSGFCSRNRVDWHGIPDEMKMNFVMLV